MTSRKTPTEPDDDTRGIGEPPRHLSAELATLWRELAQGLPAGVASQSDAPAFELTVRLINRMRHGDITASESSQLRQLLAEFGMTPAARRALTFSPFVRP